MAKHELVVGIAMEELTLDELARACAVEPEWVVVRVTEGLFPGEHGAQPEWRFTPAELRRARRMHQVERDFGAGPELAALVADMLDEIDGMRARGARGESR